MTVYSTDQWILVKSGKLLAGAIWCALFRIRECRELKATLERRRATLRESLKVCSKLIGIPMIDDII